jgi:hypothetical protein
VDPVINMGCDFPINSFRTCELALTFMRVPIRGRGVVMNRLTLIRATPFNIVHSR